MESIAGCTRRQEKITDDEDETTVIIPQQEHHDGSFSQPALEESQRGGKVWGGRLQSIVNPPEFLTFQLRTGSSKEKRLRDSACDSCMDFLISLCMSFYVLL